MVANEWTEWKWSSDVNSNYTYRNGETGHADWFGAWDYGTNTSPGVMLKWQHFCLGISLDLAQFRCIEAVILQQRHQPLARAGRPGGDDDAAAGRRWRMM